MDIGNLFNILLLQPLINLLVWIIRLLNTVGLPGTLGFSIIALTVLIKLVLWPSSRAQIKSMKKMVDLKPHLDELKKKHVNDKQALAAAQMELYKQHGVNPAGGCLPVLIQSLLIFPLYQVIQAFLEGDKGLERINYFVYSSAWKLDKLPDPNFFGINLANKPSDFLSAGPYLLLIPIVTGLLQFVLSKMMASPSIVHINAKDTPKEVNEKVKADDAMETMQTQMQYMMPVMIGFFAFQFPVGLALYWNVLNITSMIQQYQVAGWGAMQVWIDRYLPALGKGPKATETKVSIERVAAKPVQPKKRKKS